MAISLKVWMLWKCGWAPWPCFLRSLYTEPKKTLPRLQVSATKHYHEPVETSPQSRDMKDASLANGRSGTHKILLTLRNELILSMNTQTA
jgi:hypothetical protein